MPFPKQTKERTVNGPAFSGKSQGLSPEEQTIAEQEARAPKAPMGQAEADAYFKAKAAEGLEHGAVPEKIFRGESVDPEDFVDGPVIGRKAYRERFGTDMAIGRVSPQMRAKYGIEPDEFVSWTWQDNYAGGGRNYEDEWIQNNPSGRIPTDKDGNTCRMQGLVLTCLPRQVADEIQQELDDEVAEREQLLMHGNPDLPADEKEQAKMRDENTRVIQQLLQGSPTHMKDLDTALKMFTPEQTQEIVDKYRYMNRPRRDADVAGAAQAAQSQASANAIDRAVETAKAQSRGRSTFAVDGFRDKK